MYKTPKPLNLSLLLLRSTILFFLMEWLMSHCHWRLLHRHDNKRTSPLLLGCKARQTHTKHTHRHKTGKHQTGTESTEDESKRLHCFCNMTIRRYKTDLAKSIPPIFLLPCPQNCLYSSVKTSGASTESSLLKCHYVQAVIRARLSAVLSSLSPLLPSFLGCFLAVFTWVWWRGQRQCESGDRWVCVSRCVCVSAQSREGAHRSKAQAWRTARNRRRGRVRERRMRNEQGPFATTESNSRDRFGEGYAHICKPLSVQLCLTQGFYMDFSSYVQYGLLCIIIITHYYSTSVTIKVTVVLLSHYWDKSVDPIYKCDSNCQNILSTLFYPGDCGTVEE